jgi:hypothetical protein
MKVRRGKMYFVVLARDPKKDLHEERLGEFLTEAAAKEAAAEAVRGGKDAIILVIRTPHQFTVGQSGVIEDIEWR